jgi:prepilin-type N-terminal cleavage/methylation domain-containing protein
VVHVETLRGFSLVELLVVIAIIAIVLAVSIPILSRARLNAVETMSCERCIPSDNVRRSISRSSANTPQLWLSGDHLRGAALRGYTVVASPKIFGSTGRRTFYLDQDGIVHQNWGQELASGESPEFK